MELYWQASARRWRRRLNAGWWLSQFLPLLMAGALVMAVVLVAWRVAGFPLMGFAGLAGGFLVLAVAASFRSARRRFHSNEDVLVWLDVTEGTAGALLCAEDGVGVWPPPPSTTRAKLRWRRSRVAAPLLLVVTTMSIAAWVPVSGPGVEASRPRSEPIAWSSIAEAIEVLEEEDVVDEETVDEWRERLEALKAEAPETWFEHGSLEASEHLWDGMQDRLARMEKQLASVDRALEDTHDAMSDGEAQQQAESALAEALASLDKSASQLSPSMKKALKNIDPKQVQAMSEDEIEQLRQKTARGQAALRRARQAEGEGEGEGAPGEGEIKRGPGHEPLHFTGDAKTFDGSKPERLPGSDPRRAAIGDTVDVDATTHEVDPNTFRTTAGGRTEATGAGGDAVWRTSWLPREQDVLQKYFE